MSWLVFRLMNLVQADLKNNDLSQDLINKQILAHLSDLGDRLASLVHNTTVNSKKIFG